MAEYTDHTVDGVEAHRVLMTSHMDPGVCLVLCGRERLGGIVFCQECLDRWRDESAMKADTWALDQRRQAPKTLWPSWT